MRKNKKKFRFLRNPPRKYRNFGIKNTNRNQDRSKKKVTNCSIQIKTRTDLVTTRVESVMRERIKMEAEREREEWFRGEAALI